MSIGYTVQQNSLHSACFSNMQHHDISKQGGCTPTIKLLEEYQVIHYGLWFWCMVFADEMAGRRCQENVSRRKTPVGVVEFRWVHKKSP